jgi:hypothetical protein
MPERNDNRATFEQIKQIMDALKLRDLEPALRLVIVLSLDPTETDRQTLPISRTPLASTNHS